MRRIKTFALIALALALLLCLTACGGDDDGGDKVNLAENSQKVETYMNDKADDGYKIVYQITGSDGAESYDITMTMEVNGDIFAMSTTGDEGYGLIYDLSGEEFVTYTKESGDKWSKTSTPFSTYFTKETAKQTIDASIKSITAYMTYYSTAGTGDLFVKAGTATVAGKTCAKYTYSVSFGGASVTSTYYIDENSGMCLKMETSGSSGLEAASVSFECKEFTTPHTVSLPSASQITDEGGGGDGGDGGDGEGEGGDEGSMMDNEVTADEYLASLLSSGYTATYRTTESVNGEISEESSLTVASQNNLIMVVEANTYDNNTSTTYTIYNFTATGLDTYTKYNDEIKWAKYTEVYDEYYTEKMAKNLVQSSFAHLKEYTTMAYFTFTQSGTEVILGKTCTIYVYTLSYGGESVSYSFSIENESGICYKMNVTTVNEGITEVTLVECTEFITPYTITLPAEEDVYSY